MIDAIAKTISLPQGKVGQLRELLAKWPGDRRGASESELHWSMGKLLHVCEVVRPGNCFVRSMQNQLSMLPVHTWLESVRGSAGGDHLESGRSYIRLDGESCAYLSLRLADGS